MVYTKMTVNILDVMWYAPTAQIERRKKMNVIMWKLENDVISSMYITNYSRWMIQLNSFARWSWILSLHSCSPQDNNNIYATKHMAFRLRGFGGQSCFFLRNKTEQQEQAISPLISSDRKKHKRISLLPQMLQHRTNQPE